MVTPAAVRTWLAAPARLRSRLAAVRVPIRYKLLVVFSTVLLGAIGAYVYLAASLFTSDKRAYVFAANAAMVESLSEQARTNVAVLRETMALFAHEAVDPKNGDAARAQAAEAIFRAEPELVRLSLYRRAAEGGLEEIGSWDNPAQLEAMGLAAEELDRERRERPLPIESIAERRDEIYVRNASLPPDRALLAFVAAVPVGARWTIAVAELRHDRLLRSVASGRSRDTYLLDASGVVLAHADAAKVISKEDLSAHPLVQEALLARADQEVREYEAGDAAMLGGYARVDPGRLLVLTQVTREEAFRAGRDLIRRSAYFALAVLLAGILVSVFLSRLVTSPIRRLRSATEVVAQGRFDFQVDDERRDEIGDLACSFVSMARALRNAQAHLVRSEKLAAFGQLGAGITHELKNPLTGIVGFAQIAQRKLDQPAKIEELLKLIEGEGLRCKEILVNFLKFARQQSGRDTQRVAVNELVRSSAKIVGHQLSLHDVRLDVELAPELPEVVVNGGEIQQVLLNLALNAQQAMPEGGKVRFATARAPDGRVEISVSDDGPGIPEEIGDQIFEPFFTTKPAGEGTGLGLAISFGIVRDHGGTLTVQSEPGKGATFFIRLPAAASAAPASPASPAATEGPRRASGV